MNRKPLIGLTLLMCLLVGVLWLVLARAAPVRAGGVVGSGTPASCNDTALNNALAGGGSVTFNCGAAAVNITLSTTKDIIVDTMIDGGGLVTLSGAGLVRVLKVEAGATLVLNNLTVSNGHVDNDYGGAIRNSGLLIVNNSRVVNSQTTGNGANSGGGGISSEGTLTVTNSVISGNASSVGGGINSNAPTAIVNSQIWGNTATESGGGVFIYIGGKASISGGAIFSNTTTGLMIGGGAGIYNVDTLSLDHVNVLGNSSQSATTTNGGGILNTASGTMTLTSVLLSGNSVGFYGGGIYNAGAATLNNSTLKANSTGYGGGISNFGTLTLNDSTLSGNPAASAGGGIYAYGGTATLNNSTLSGNTAGGGGGIYNYHGSILTLTNSTLSGNTASGGGIENFESTAVLINVTFSGNSASGSGGGIYHNGSTAPRYVSIRNSIVANSPSGGNCYRDPGSSSGSTINSLGYNLSSDTSCQVYFNQLTDLPPSTDPNLGPLANNGGPTLTHLPLTPDSPGIDAIPHFTNGCGTTVSRDQRGAPRPFNLKCDIGAVEYGAQLLRLWLPLIRR